MNGSAFVPVNLGTWDVTDASVVDINTLAAQLQDRVNDALGALVPAQPWRRRSTTPRKPATNDSSV